MSLSFVDCCFLTIPKRSYRLTWEVTQYCPYSCEYCFTWSTPQRAKFEANISLATRKLISFIEHLGVEDVLITGGEPLSILDDLSQFLTYLNGRKIPFSVSSTLYSRDL